jgi:preprotein translocase subunit SecD
MKRGVSYRLVIFIAALIFGVAFSTPSLLNLDKGHKVTLGLDLQGGLYMLLGVKTQEAVENRIRSMASAVSHHTEGNDILIDELQFSPTEVSFYLIDNQARSDLERYLDTLEGVVADEANGHYTLYLSPEEAERTRSNAVEQAVETIRNRLDQFGLAEPTVAKQGTDQVLVELPGIKTAEEEQRARALIGQTAQLRLMAIDEKNAARADLMSDAEAESMGSILMPDVYDESRRHLVRQIAILDGSMLTDARVGFDEQNQPVINFTLDSEGAQIFGNFTGRNVGNRLAVVLDGRVYSAPVIRERIGGGSGQISGAFSLQEANDLAIALRSGALSASVEMQERRSVGPTLGADSIKASLIALVAGFVLVTLFMVAFYRKSGMVSNLALITNLFIILAVMALFGATLTLPGMVGIVLTVGMAVDANVIINERIKELLHEGKSVAKAIDEGYDNAFSAILDANLTTLIAAMALYAYGTGPIKGFAITLSIGILASMLTAIIGTRGILDLIGHRINKQNVHAYFGTPKKREK